MKSRKYQKQLAVFKNCKNINDVFDKLNILQGRALDITLDFSKVDDYITLNIIYSAQGKINNDPTKICGIIISENEGFVYKYNRKSNLFDYLFPLFAADFLLFDIFALLSSLKNGFEGDVILPICINLFLIMIVGLTIHHYINLTSKEIDRFIRRYMN